MRKNHKPRNTSQATKPTAVNQPTVENQQEVNEPAPPLQIENGALISMLNQLHAEMSLGKETVMVHAGVLELLLAEVMLSRMNSNTPSDKRG